MDSVVVYLYAPHLLADLQQAQEPSLQGQPVAIVHEGRLMDLSWEARRMGIALDHPLHQARVACPALQLRPYRAEEVKARLTRWWQALVPDSAAVEPDGMQGVFVERALPPHADPGEPLPSRLERMAHQLLRRTVQVLPARVVVGLGANKLAAKAAALQQARRWESVSEPSPHRPPSAVDPLVPDRGRGRGRRGPSPAVGIALPLGAFMERLPIELLWPLPEALREQLWLLGLRTAGDIAAMGPEALVGRFGSLGWQLWNWSRGLDGSPVVPAYPPPSIARWLDLESPDAPGPEAGALLEARVREWAATMARELKATGQMARYWGLSLTLHPPRGWPERELSVMRTVLPGERQHHPQAMADMASRLLHRVLEQACPWQERGARPRLMRLAAFAPEPARYRQPSILLDSRLGSQARLRKVLEMVNRRVGPGYVRPGSEVAMPWREARLALLEQGAWLP